MAQEIITTTPENSVEGAKKISLLKTKEEMLLGDYLRNYTLEILAICLWVYTITKIFIFDLDIWFVHLVAPGWEWILSFKLIFILASASVVWTWVGTRDVIIWFLYITLYPLIILFIKLPHYIFKQRSWLLAFAILNAAASFFSNLKYTLIFATLFLSSFAIVFFSHVLYLLPAGTCVLVTLVLVAYVKSFLSALKPTVIFQIYSKFFKGIRKVAHASFALDTEIRDLPVELLEPKQLEKWNTSLQTSVLFNRFCLFTATRLRGYQRSEWQMIPSIFGLLWLIIFTVISFSGIYFALFKINPTLFDFTQRPTFFTFLFFSFNNLTLNSTPDMVASTILSQSVYILQASLSFLLGVILATLLISHRVQKTSSELDEVIIAVEGEAKNMEGFIRDEYKIESVTVAMERLKEMQLGLVQFIYWLSKEIS